MAIDHWLFSMLFDLYVSRPGWLHQLDPRTKIAMVLCGAVLFVVLRDVATLLALLVALHVILLTARVPLRQVGWVWRQLWRIVLIVVLIWPLFAGVPGPRLFSLGPVVVSTNSVLLGISTATRVVGMSLLFFVILFTTRQNHLVQGLVRLGMPFEWGLTLAIALRYIPTFAHTVTQIQEAQAARAWRVDRTNIIDRLRSIIPILTALIINVLRTSDTLGMALAARGVGTNAPRTTRQDICFTFYDWLALTVALLAFAGLVWGRFAMGL